MDWIEEEIDRRLAASALRELAAAGGRPEKAGWSPWEEAQEEWIGKQEDGSELPPG